MPATPSGGSFRINFETGEAVRVGEVYRTLSRAERRAAEQAEAERQAADQAGPDKSKPSKSDAGRAAPRGRGGRAKAAEQPAEATAETAPSAAIGADTAAATPSTASQE